MMSSVWLACLRLMVPSALRAAVMSDTMNTLANVEARLGRRAARRWLRAQVRGAIWPAVRYRFGSGTAGVQAAWRSVASLGADVRLVARGALRQPAFSSAVVLTLGLGIGGSVAIFSVVDAVLFRPLPYPDSAAGPRLGVE